MRTLDIKNFFVPGYKAWGISCGIKKNEKKDLAIIFSDREASVAGVFTRNLVKAAPVLLDMAKVKSGKGQAIVVNSGCANACTGKRGLADARETAEAAAHELGVAHAGVEEPDQERPDALDVPGEPVAPGDMCPDAASDHAQSKKAEAEKHYQLAKKALH